jgi:hypothetical protein
MDPNDDLMHEIRLHLRLARVVAAPDNCPECGTRKIPVGFAPNSNAPLLSRIRARQKNCSRCNLEIVWGSSLGDLV